jgi:hypothetical protein
LAAPWIILHIFAFFIKVFHPISVPLTHSWHVLYTPHKVNVECRAVSCFLLSRNRLQTAFHMWRAFQFSWTLKTQRTMRKCRSIGCRLLLCLPKGPTNSAHMLTIVTAALQWQYMQMELILWICLVFMWII